MLKVEIVDTPIALAHGLMFRRSLDRNEGMLFKFTSPTFAPFWGTDTYIPLDVAFINADNKIVDIKKIVPMSTRQVGCSGIYIMAIETNDGFFEKNGIKVGDTIKLKTDNETSYVDFQKCF